MVKLKHASATAAQKKQARAPAAGGDASGTAAATESGRKRRLLISIASLVVLAILIVAGVIGYLAVQQHRSPSGKVFVETARGKVELTVPDTLAKPPTPASARLPAPGPEPPTALKIASIGVDAPVYMMAGTSPQAAVVAWLYRSAMPGTNGNAVFYGARSGADAVFGQLDQLRVGTTITVIAPAVAYTYQITSIREVDVTDTDPLLPTTTPTVTLLTDAGEWDPTAGRYTKRLVVRATYLAVKPWSGQ